MGKKEYEHAAAYVREMRKSNRHGDMGEGLASNVEDAFVDLFNTFDSKGKFDQRRFLTACKGK